MAIRRADAGPGLEVFLLDMGFEKYGDAILCRRGATSVLIDGGHPRDMQDRQGYRSIPNQLAQLFGHEPPFDLTLLVVTHCHNDHIGCLPELVADGIVRPQWALVADENLGFGRPAIDPSPIDAADVTPAMQRLVAALREEDHSELSDAELSEFLADVETLEDRYLAMLDRLGQQLGPRLVRYGRDDAAPLEAALAPIGLRVLGPSTEHLLICAQEIERSLGDAVDDLRDVIADGPFGDAATLDELAVYRALMRERLSDDADSGRPGYALNNQSIVLQFQTSTANVLLTGDMQFTEPVIDELEPLMAELRQSIADAAPFDLVKIAHHGSHNAFDRDVLAEMGDTPRYVISGGIRDRGHPDSGVLSLLRQRRASAGIEWARTDKNGLISVTFGPQGRLDISRGRRNSTRPNYFDLPAAAMQPAAAAVGPLAMVAPMPVPPAPPQQPLVPLASSASGGENIRIVAEIPPHTARVTITVEVQPHAAPFSKQAGPGGDGQIEVRLGGGRPLPPLLFVTSRAALQRNIGPAATDSVLQAVRAAGQPLLDQLPEGASEPNQVLSAVRAELNSRPQARGVVILGGYDVVPASRLDTIDPPLRTAIRQVAAVDPDFRDEDDFVVWSDAVYGDRDGDGMGELPVSRIPDGHSASLMLRAIGAGRSRPGRRAGIRNHHRPYADAVFQGMSYGQHPKLLVAYPTGLTAAEHAQGHLHGAAVYLMLHGDYQNPALFSGEQANRRAFPAMNTQNIAEQGFDDSVVFAGCCWGALTVEERAIDVLGAAPVTPLAPDRSMALKFLQAGALAFVGCTGVHYSPGGPAPTHNGGPLHVAFWKHYAQGSAPAEALFQAKTDYIAGMPYQQNSDAFEQAIELKLLREFTCLGLGW